MKWQFVRVEDSKQFVLSVVSAQRTMCLQPVHLLFSPDLEVISEQSLITREPASPNPPVPSTPMLDNNPPICEHV